MCKDSDNFDFVAFPYSVNNQYITSLSARRGKKSGYADIEITAVDDLYLGSGFCHYENGKGIIGETQTFIPASSLKGAVRQVARASSESCIPLDRIDVPVLDGNGEVVTTNRNGMTVNKSLKGQPFLTCGQKRKCNATPDKDGKIQVCIVCDMFGAMSLASKVRFTDLQMRKGKTETVSVPVRFSPHTEADNYWYRDDENDRNIYYKGYKFYYTKCNEREEPKKEKVTVIKSGAVFKGRVYFKNLFDDQLELLLHSLGAGKNISLKLGGYKADGFGTVNAVCEKLVVNDKKENAFQIAKKFVDKNKDYLEELESILEYREN